MFALGKVEAMLIVAAVIGLVIVKKNAGSLAAAVAAGVVDTVGEASTGVVYGIGDAIGLPRTSETECEKAMREGRTWDASFVCPASTFIKYLGS